MNLTVDHFILEVSDPIEAIGFFREVLGLTPVRLEDYQAGKAPFPSVRVNDSLVIDVFPPRLWSTNGPRNPNHVCFAMSRAEFDSVNAQLRERQIAITKTDERNFGARGWGHSVYFDGPEHISIEIRFYPGD